MNWLDGVFEKISPAYALKREIAKARLARLRNLHNTERRSFEALSGDRLHNDFLKPSNSADSAISGDLENLRNHIRQNEYNNGHFAGPIQRWANHVIGRGLRFQSRVEPDKKSLRLGNIGRISPEIAEAFNFLAERRFKTWNKQADKRLIQTWYEMQWLACAAKFRDGEVLIIGRKSKKKNRLIPYCQEIIEIDRLQTPRDFIQDDAVRNGIRFDDEGAPSHYYILKQHPGDSLSINYPLDEYETIPVWNPNGTRKIIHLFRITRPEQTRGLSRFAAALKGFQNAFRYSEAEMYAALEDACMTGFVKTNAPQTFQDNYTDVTKTPQNTGDDNSQKIHEFAPNKWHYLANYEDVYIRDPSRPNDKFDEIIKSFHRDPANALDMPIEVLLQDWKDINYSNARTILLQFYVPVILEQAYFMDHYCEATYENVLADLVAKGHVRAPGFISRKEDYLNCEWITPEREWVDPEKEAAGKEKELLMKITNPYELCGSRGKDYDQTLEGYARALKKQKELEKQYGIKFPSAEKETDPAAQKNKQQTQNKPKAQKGRVLEMVGNG